MRIDHQGIEKQLNDCSLLNFDPLYSTLPRFLMQIDTIGTTLGGGGGGTHKELGGVDVMISKS